MSDVKKSLVASVVVLATMAAIVTGNKVRERIEVGPGIPVGGPITSDAVVASGESGVATTDTSKDPISETALFYQLMLLLEKDYVDPITDERALAVGAVHGMVDSLADSSSVFYKSDEMKSLDLLQKGTYTGIGAEFKLVYNEDELAKYQHISISAEDSKPNADYDPVLLIPAVIVSSVAEGGPADKSGLRAGDRITMVDDKWAISSAEVKEIRGLRAKVDSGKMTAEQIKPAIDAFRQKLESSIVPAKVTKLLAVGTSGSVKVGWLSPDGRKGSATIGKSKIKEMPVGQNNGTIDLKFFSGAETLFAQAINGKQKVTIDLRESTLGDYDTMRKCLALVAPDGEYGTISTEQVGAPHRLTVVDGAKTKRDISLIVDGSTWGAAAVFAKALTDAGIATIQEGSLTGSLPWIQVVRLPDGSGYTLHTGDFTTEASQ
ncbi:MAG TPA: PDZ domain-containing protein [Fimbriimonadaceae bacterium]|nr:PDZ domain-containing protein [Fimbriimonadaceae bacterium]